MLQYAFVILLAAAPTVKSTSDTENESGLRLMQVRAIMLYQKGFRTSQLLVEPNSSSLPAVLTDKAQDAVAQAALGSKVSSTIFSGNGSSSDSEGEREGYNSSLASHVVNKTLQDVIINAERKAITNATVAHNGAKALARKQLGRRTPKEKTFEKTVEGDLPNSTIEDELNNATIQKAIRDRVEEAVDAEVVKKVASENRLPTQTELNETVSNELREIWYDLIHARRHQKAFEANVSMWKSVAFFDWSLLAVALVAFVVLYHVLRDWPTTRMLHGGALLIWIAMAVLYNGMICLRLGEDPGIHWLIGYLLEFIFSIENLFVYHIIVKAFRAPRGLTQRLFFIVVIFQLVFQFVFYMGLGRWLRSLQFLPYLLGAWLIYLGCQAVLEEEEEDFDIMQTRAVSWIQFLLGDRLLLENGGSDAIFATKDGKTCLCPPGLLLLCLLVADFLLEVDVTVTKIEGFPSRYLCFSSSAVASFALPELFFVARDLFHRFFALKYGISFVLIFVGAQALLHKLFTLTAVTSLAIIVSVIILSILVSMVFRLGKGFIGTEEVGPRHAG